MFQEIEQKVSSLSVVSSEEQEEAHQEAQQEAEALSSKLEVLKESLVTFQIILQEKHTEEQVHTHTHTQVTKWTRDLKPMQF